MKLPIKWLTIFRRGRVIKIPVTFEKTIGVSKILKDSPTKLKVMAKTRLGIKLGEAEAHVSGKFATAEWVGVRPEVRGGGLGRRLFGELVDLIKKATPAQEIGGRIVHPHQFRIRQRRFPGTEFKDFSRFAGLKKINRFEAWHRVSTGRPVFAFSKIKRPILPWKPFKRKK